MAEAEVVLGFDGSFSNDSTALVVVSDDAAQNELIAELRTQLAAAQEAAENAGVLEGQLADALAAADAAAVKLESNDPVVAEPPGDEPVEPPVDGGQV